MQKSRVLLADDDPGLRRLVGATLGADQFDILAAGDGEETLEIARRLQPALILLDIDMPKRTGTEICRILKEDPTTSAIKIVFLTASGNESDRVKAIGAAADDYIVKPFSPVALLDKVYALLS
jgi:two-component system, OmpR family, alkaline phosphatase synthesis response regulator PhoP